MIAAKRRKYSHYHIWKAITGKSKGVLRSKEQFGFLECESASFEEEIGICRVAISHKVTSRRICGYLDA